MLPRLAAATCAGVCGTMLAVRDAGTGGDGERCWVTLRNADPAYKNVNSGV
jgi:hypothetical protein